MSPDAESRRGQPKSALRLEMRRHLSGLDSGARAMASAAIAERLTNSEQWSTARAVAAFVGVGLEVDTLPIIECAQRQGKHLLLPRCLSSTTLETAVLGFQNPWPTVQARACAVSTLCWCRGLHSIASAGDSEKGQATMIEFLLRWTGKRVRLFWGWASLSRSHSGCR
jgi:hypothetical protein